MPVIFISDIWHGIGQLWVVIAGTVVAYWLWPLTPSLGMTADLIGQDTSSSALVFGLMSLTDKVE